MKNEFDERMSNLSDKEWFDILNNKKGDQEKAFDNSSKEGFRKK